ncbi:UDP-glucose 4-epimerase GalE [Permianibacter sp. IMCC34836]|uniref:UDP-glucose 4-epimerase GalE n=1 Tax=Permianibacter fluminis TaxID=2738515 RepID=UPI00155416BE|nr:UDP-glucose 4-epimerase GalE [Permianibacter fluminis]NQD37561.1 UDP-glucose 4-epimerase GalE [Permianibacter fluminis]
MKPGILVTGGAGYIGSHVVRQLGERGENVFVLDNLSTGRKEAVLYGQLIVGDTGDRELVLKVLREHNIKSILHFAANTVVPESVEKPLQYYRNNTVNVLNLLECCQAAGVEHFIFSSTAAVYGTPDTLMVTEQSPTRPESPYGLSKLMSEWLIRDYAATGAIRHVTLRYFNVAGADPEARIGQATPNATHLIKVAVEALCGKRSSVSVFGTDYPTADGTGVRDYIHVEDLAAAHLSALDYLRNNGQSVTLNCGYGHGYSVLEVLKTAEQVAGKPLTINYAPRRAGDLAAIAADSSKLRQLLSWQPKFDDLKTIVKHALAWEQKIR